MPKGKLIVFRRRRRSLWWMSLAALVRKPSMRSCSRYEVRISWCHVQVWCHGVMRSKYYRYYANSNTIMSWTHVSGTVEQRNTSEVSAFNSVFAIVLWDIHTFVFWSVFWEIFLSVFWIIKAVLNHKDNFGNISIGSLDYKNCFAP